MNFPTAVAFHGIESPDALRAEALERVRGLESFLDDILACRVLVEADSPWLHHGCHYGVYVRVTMPCIEIEAGGKAVPDALHMDPYRTMEETFESLTCRVEDFVRRRCSTCDKYLKPHRAA